MGRMFTSEQGYRPEDLIHSGIDHLSSAEVLFEHNPYCYDSAGYLAHLGIEIILKGMRLYALNSFSDTHNITKIYDDLVQASAAPPLDPEERELLIRLGKFEKLRYPKPEGPVEIGSDDLSHIKAFASKLLSIMPE